MMLTMKPNLTHSNLTVQAPPWDTLPDDPTANDADTFRMYEFKIRKCTRVRSHDWTECPFAHPGEKARRRDPRKVNYSGATCPDFRKGTCTKGDTCGFSHGVFETWLHPSRYRTQPCKDGANCHRLVCFFAHTQEQIRVLPNSPSRLGLDSDATLPESPPMSPMAVSEFPVWGNGIWPSQLGRDSVFTQYGSPPMSPVSELSVSMRNMGMSISLPCWEMGQLSTGPSFFSLPSTPTEAVIRPGSVFDLWDEPIDEEPLMKRVESGRDLRARMYAKLSRENSVDQDDPVVNGPDMSWISELVK